MLFSTHIELAVALEKEGKAGGINLWRVVQQWKAISLSDLLWNSQGHFPSSSNIDEEAKSLEEEERCLVNKIEEAEPYERPDLRRKLRMHWMQMASHPAFTNFTTLKLGMGATFVHLNQIQQISHRLGSEDNALIFVDWIRHHNNIFLFAVRCSQSSQTLTYWCLPLNYADVTGWVSRKLRQKSGSSRTDPLMRRRLENADDLMELSPLIDPLRNVINDEELLVLCPSGILHEIPIHAIPFSENNDPLLSTNPIVYSSSQAIMKSCVDMAFQKLDSGDRSSKKFVACGRFGDSDPTEDNLIKEMVVELAKQFDGIHVTGEVLKRDVFKTFTSDADFIHYHGHATCEEDTSMRSLVLQPDPGSGDSGKFTVDDIFKLQLHSPHVTLLACASGEQEVLFNDDPFGIVTAFLCAGATSVAATLWPTDVRDAREFCDVFYSQIKDERDPVINLAKVMQKTVLKLRADWDSDEPYHWAQFILCKFLVRSSKTLSFDVIVLRFSDGSWFCPRFKTMGTVGCEEGLK